MNFLQRTLKNIKRKAIAIPQQAIMQALANLNRRSWIQIATPTTQIDYIQQGFQQINMLYSAINKKWNAAQQIDIKLMKMNSDGTKEEIFDHPALDLIRRPNMHMTWDDLLQYYFAYYDTTGNFYLSSLELDNGTPVELWIMPSQYTRILAEERFLYDIKGYNLQAGQIDIDVEAERVLHMKNINLDFDGNGRALYGMSPLIPLTNSIRSQNGVETASISLLRNGGVRGLLTLDGSIVKEGFEVPGTPELDEVNEQYRRKYKNEYNYGDIPITSIPFKFLDMGLNAIDLQLIDQSKWNLENIANNLNVPLPLLSQEKSTMDNMRQASKNLYIHEVIPKVDKLVQGLNRWLLPKFGDPTLKFKIDTSNVMELQKDLESIARWVQVIKPELTTNEVRETFGYGKLEDPLADVPIYERQLLLGSDLPDEVTNALSE